MPQTQIVRPTLQCRLRELMAEKGRRDGVRITYRMIREHTGIALNTLSGFAGTPLPKLLGRSVIERLCGFFDCSVDELFIVVYQSDAQEGET